jgi:glutaredoxin 3
MQFQIYSKPNCPYCVKAKALLRIKGLEFIELELGKDFTREELLSWFPHARTYPQIEIWASGSATYIGGYDDLEKYLRKDNVTSNSQ